MKIKKLAQTPDYLVIEKPPGLTIHNENTKEPSVLSHLGGSLFPVHRLDKETSGLVVLAKNATAAAVLAEQFRLHRVRKVYTALLRGSLPVGTKIHWKKALTDKAEGRKNPQGLARDRKDCLTEGQVIESNPYLSLVELEIKTGRQHQIRKHAALAKHPLVGDARYNDLSYNEKIQTRFGTDRMFLHASSLEFEWQGRRMNFTSPLPGDFHRLLSGG